MAAGVAYAAQYGKPQGLNTRLKPSGQENAGFVPFMNTATWGIKQATEGRVEAHVIRAAAGTKFSSQAHIHKTAFQLVYVLKGRIEFEYESQRVVRLEAGSCVHQQPEIRHREVGHSANIEMLEIVLPGDFKTLGDGLVHLFSA